MLTGGKYLNENKRKRRKKWFSFKDLPRGNLHSSTISLSRQRPSSLLPTTNHSASSTPLYSPITPSLVLPHLSTPSDAHLPSLYPFTSPVHAHPHPSTPPSYVSGVWIYLESLINLAPSESEALKLSYSVTLRVMASINVATHTNSLLSLTFIS